MGHHSKYSAKIPNKNGFIEYSEEENQVWCDLYHRQFSIIQKRACDDFIKGLNILNLSTNKIPQLKDVTQALKKTTGWSVSPVQALISVDEFFDLIANKHFPAATFIRNRNEIDYLKEPDIFHELFGHCPMLTVQKFADFMQIYGQIAMKASQEERALLGRLYWFTVEFGLIQQKENLRIYGGGILSSTEETIYSLKDSKPIRQPYDTMKVLRTPYRIDKLQSTYFVIRSYQELYELISNNLIDNIDKAIKLGDFPANFSEDD